MLTYIIAIFYFHNNFNTSFAWYTKNNLKKKEDIYVFCYFFILYSILLSILFSWNSYEKKV